MKRYRGREITKFNKIDRSINRDRPAIIMIASGNPIIGDHYVTVEGTIRIYKKWRPDPIGYLVNMGHGNSRKWNHLLKD